jgi:fructose-bisphosphate aldolase, class I
VPTDMDNATHSKTGRLTLDEMDLSVGKRARLHTLLYAHGPGNGTMMFLPIDQGLEHGPVDFFVNPEAKDPEFQCKLALAGNYSAVVFHYGLALKYMSAYAGKVPLVLKLNGKTNVPADDASFSPLTATVQDAVRLGASAVGYTLYVGSPAQDRDIEQLRKVREDCDRFGMPLILWAYPRGSAIKAKGGQDSVYAIDYAARVACEVGADVVKVNFPDINAAGKANSPKEYAQLTEDFAASVKRIVQSAGKTMVLFSGGGMIDDEALIAQAKIGMEAGGTGLIFGRNMWQRPMDKALTLSARLTDMLRSV